MERGKGMNNRGSMIAPISEMVCSTCSAPIPSSANFCPNCGRGLKKKPLSTALSRQVIVYLVSFFLAPFGLWYAWKYLKQEDNKSKIIGVTAIALTAISIALAIWTMAGLFNSVRGLMRSLNGLAL
jgi:hypothetical protein